MQHDFVSALILLLLVLDPLGSLPIFIPVMRQVAPERRHWVALREVGIAFTVLFVFMFVGEGFLRVMRLSERSLEVAGGVILLMVAIRMIFGSSGGVYGVPEGKEPLISFRWPCRCSPGRRRWRLCCCWRLANPTACSRGIGALACAMAVSLLVLLMCNQIRRVVGDSVVSATEKLMGLVLTAIAVEMILAGLKRYFLG